MQSKVEIKHITAAFFLAVVGLGISAYATYHHLLLKAFGKTDAFCNINQTISCDAVAKSEFSEIFGIPVAVIGVGFFLGICLAVLLKNVLGYSNKTFFGAYGILSWGSCLVSIVLGSISVGIIGVVCPSCLGVYIVSGLMGLHSILLIKHSNYTIGGEIMKCFAVIGFTLIGTIAVNAISQRAQAVAPATQKQDAPKSLPVIKHDIPVYKSPYTGSGEDYRKGNDEAKVVIVEFADFECPACGMMSKTLQEVHKAYQDRVLIVFKNYPLDSKCNKDIKAHKYACDAATIARCAGQYGNFWKLHDKFFDKQQELTPGNMRAWAKETGLTDAQIEGCLKSVDIAAKIKDDIAIADRIGLQGTPSIYINGVEYQGRRDAADLAKYLDQLLK